PIKDNTKPNNRPVKRRIEKWIIDNVVDLTPSCVLDAKPLILSPIPMAVILPKYSSCQVLRFCFLFQHDLEHLARGLNIYYRTVPQSGRRPLTHKQHLALDKFPHSRFRDLPPMPTCLLPHQAIRTDDSRSLL